MSQIYKRETAGQQPPSVPTKFNTDVQTDNMGNVTPGGQAVPTSNQLDLKARDTQENNENGIRTNNDESGSRNLYVELTNRIRIAFSTLGTGDLITDHVLMSMNTAPHSGVTAAWTIDLRVAALQGSGVGMPAAAVYTLFSGFRSDGTTPFLIGDTDKIVHEEASLQLADCTLAVVGNDLVLRVTGIVAKGINWDVVGEYTRSE